MVVTKPEGGDTEVLHKPKEGEAPQTGSRHQNIGYCKQPNVNKANTMQNPVSRLRSQSNFLNSQSKQHDLIKGGVFTMYKYSY